MIGASPLVLHIYFHTRGLVHAWVGSGWPNLIGAMGAGQTGGGALGSWLAAPAPIGLSQPQRTS